jgi:hypothetical protein
VSTLTDLVSKLLAAQIAPVVQGRIESELRQKLASGNVEDLAAGLAQARQQA